VDGRWETLAVVLLLFVSGSGWLALLRYRPSCGPERLALAFGGGAAWLAVLTIALGAFRQFRPVVVIPFLLLPLVGLVGGRAAALDRRSWLAGWPGFLLVVPFVVLTFWFAVHRPVWSIDAQRRWVLHAQWTADEATATPERMQDPEWGMSHPSYPPLVSSVLALALQLGADRDEGMRIAFPFYFLGLLGVVYSFARRRAPPMAAALLTLALAATPCLSVLDALRGAFGLGADAALADIPLAFFVTALLVLVLDALDAPVVPDSKESGAAARSRWAVAGLIGLGAVLSKNEGLVYAPVAAAIAAVALFVACPGGALAASRKRALVLFGVLAAGALSWKVAARDMAIREGEGYLTSEVFGSLAAGFERFAAIADRMGDEMADQRLWGVLWFVPFVWLLWFLVTAPRLDRDQIVRRVLPFVWLVAGLAMVLAAYLATGWKEGNWMRLMEVSLARLLIHHAPLALMLVCDLFVDRDRIVPTEAVAA
jgi:hypothetical protein